MDALEVLDLLKELKAYGEEEKILSSFIPAFIDKTLPHGEDEYLHGSLNLGGTISGRLSSSEPNLTNLPSSGTRFAKPVKQCFAAPKGWLMVGADFSSLEDRVNTLQTRDPNKLKVYTDGYDSHSLRAYAYFKEQMPDIELAAEGERCYTANVGGTEILFKGSDKISHEGKIYSGDEFYEICANRRL